MNFSNFDFDLFEDIPTFRRYYDTPRVTVTKKGLFSMNSAMQKDVGDQREFRAKTSPDGRYLALYITEEPNVRFSPKNANVTHMALARHLEEKGIQLPVYYEMEWCQQQQAWIGCCQELPVPPDVAKLAKTKGELKKQVTRRDV